MKDQGTKSCNILSPRQILETLQNKVRALDVYWCEMFTSILHRMGDGSSETYKDGRTQVRSRSNEFSGEPASQLSRCNDRKNSLTLQLSTAQLLAAYEELEQRNTTLEDIKAQKNWLERCVAFFAHNVRLPMLNLVQRAAQPAEPTETRQ